jgi:2-dehydropantoate 2-reductase
MQFKRIAVMGAGSLGTILGAYITRGGRQIDLVDANPAQVDALNSKGATVCGTVSLNVPVHAITPDKLEGKYDLFLYMVKQIYNGTAIPQMTNHLADGGHICVFQNGIPESAVAEVIGEDYTLGATVGWGATLLEPGVSEATTLQDQWFFNIGTLKGTVTKELEELKTLLELMCPTHIETDWMPVRWQKMIANVAMSGMSAALGCTFGDILDNKQALLCAQHLARECVRVTMGLGYTCVFDPKLHVTIDKLFNFTTPEQKAVTDMIFQSVWGSHRASKASMLQDIEKGQKSEIDAINGVLSTSGRECGVPTPVSDNVIKIVHEIEAGKRKATWENLQTFDFFDGIEIVT